MRLKRIGMTVAAAAAALLALMVVFGSWYTIDQGELGVVLRTGRVVGVAEPGLHFKAPLVESVEVMDLRTQLAYFEAMATYSKDQQPAELTLSVNWRLDPAAVAEIYANYGNSLAAIQSRLVDRNTAEATKVVFGQYNAITAIQERGRLATQIEDAVRAAVGQRGVIVESVQLENIDFSDAYEQSIEARMQAEVEVAKLNQQLEQDKVNANRRREVAAGEADAVRAAAQAEADALRARAAAEAEAIRLRGEAEALAIRARGGALRDSPDLILLTQAERWNGVLPSMMVPGGAVPMLDLQSASR